VNRKKEKKLPEHSTDKVMRKKKLKKKELLQYLSNRNTK
jgi:hypothetical protein